MMSGAPIPIIGGLAMAVMALITGTVGAQTPPLPPSQPATAAPMASIPLIDPATAVRVQDLGALDPNSIGVLDESKGGLAVDLWAKTDIAVIEHLLPLLPGPEIWRSVWTLEDKLLLSAVAAPAGGAGLEPLINLRAARLWALGDTLGLDALLRTVPHAAITPALRRMRVDLALLNNDVATACAEAMPLNASDPADFYPLKLQAYCQLSNGQTAAAALTIDLVRDQKPVDTAFFAAADGLRGFPPGGKGTAPLTLAPQALTPLTVAMTRAANIALPDSVAGTPQPALWRALVNAPNVSLDAKLQLAEKGETAGTVGIDQLRDLYAQVPFTPQEVAAVAVAPVPPKGIRGRAMLFHAIEGQFEAGPQATLIAKALALAEGQPGYFTVARLYAPALAVIPQTAELSWFAVPAARALLAAGNPESASGWIALTRLTADDSSNLAAVIGPLATLSGATATAAPPFLAGWIKTQNLADPPARRRTAVLFGLLAALGESVPPADWFPLYETPAPITVKMAPPALRYALQDAVAGRRKGETVLAALDSLSDLAQADPLELSTVVAALRTVGLDTDARALAVEAAIANGI